MNDISLSHASWLQPFNIFFKARGVDLTPYYEAAKIKPEIVNNEDGWLTKQQLYRFLNLVAEGEHMPDLGFAVGATMTPDTVEGLNTALAQATTLHEAIHLFSRFINRHVENNRSWLEDGESGEIWLLNKTLNPFTADRDIADHAGLMILMNVVRLVTGPDWFPAKVRLQSQETDSIQKVDELRTATTTFNAKATGLAFPAIWLYRPLKNRADDTTCIPLDERLLNEGERLSDKIMRLLYPLVGTAGMAPSLELLAHICGLNSRTLQRRLRAEGTTFGAILEKVRMKKADQLLNTDLSIKAIAWELGYSGPNNFIRAFKRGKGLTPNAYRLKKPYP